MDYSQKCYAKWKNPGIKDYIFSHSVYIKSRKGKVIVLERSVIAKGWGGRRRSNAKGSKKTLEEMDMIYLLWW